MNVTCHTRRKPHLRIVRDAHPLPSLPPRKPVRTSAAVRKSLRAALAAAQVMRKHLDDADARFPKRADKAANGVATYAAKLAALSVELKHSLHCERQRDLWRKGKPYVE